MNLQKKNIQGRLRLKILFLSMIYIFSSLFLVTASLGASTTSGVTFTIDKGEEGTRTVTVPWEDGDRARYSKRRDITYLKWQNILDEEKDERGGTFRLAIPGLKTGTYALPYEKVKVPQVRISHSLLTAQEHQKYLDGYVTKGAIHITDCERGGDFAGTFEGTILIKRFYTDPGKPYRIKGTFRVKLKE